MDIEIFRAKERAPIVYVNSTEKNGKALQNEIKAKCDKPFNLVVFSPIDWNNDLSPWKEEALTDDSSPFGGNADIYLEKLLNEITEIEMDIDIEYRVLAGYSLAGLFAIYAAFRTDLFSRIAAASASLWYPGFIDFMRREEISKSVTHAYFSLGDKERHTNLELLRSVEDRTREAETILKERGIITKFELNRGNHFKGVLSRTAKAISWALTPDKASPLP